MTTIFLGPSTMGPSTTGPSTTGPSTTGPKISSNYDFSERKTQGIFAYISTKVILLEFKIRHLLAFTVMFYFTLS